MHLIDFSKIYNDVVSYVVVTVFGGLVTWVVTLKRRVNTNEALIKANTAAHDKQIALIMQRLDSRDRLDDDRTDRMDRIEMDVRESRRDIHEIKNAIIGKS